jgi:hypothetical protein
MERVMRKTAVLPALLFGTVLALMGHKADAASSFLIHNAPLMQPERDGEQALHALEAEAAKPPVTRVQSALPDMDRSEAMRDLLKAQGFSQIDRLRHKGDVFIAEATGPEGKRMRVVIDAETGELAGLRMIGRDKTPLY